MAFTTLFLNSLLSQGMGLLIGNFFGRFGGPGGQTLEAFLNTLSTDFTRRVENVVRDAFEHQNFLEVKTQVIGAATFFRTFIASKELDKNQLDQAHAAIVIARSRLFAACEGYHSIGDSKEIISLPDPQEKGRRISQHLRVLEAAMAALQAIAALDLLILAKKAETYPDLTREIVTRIEEYDRLATRLKETFIIDSSFRVWHKLTFEVSTAHYQTLNTRSFAATPVHILHETIYKDGEAVKKEDQSAPYLMNEEEQKEYRKTYVPCLREQTVQMVKEVTEGAEQKLKATGNLEEARDAWKEVGRALSQVESK